MAQKFFDRRVRVLVAAPIKEDFASISADLIEITDLRVAFTVSKGLSKEPNKAEVVVTNLAPDKRARIRERCKFILQAGYAEGISQLFVGDVRRVEHEHTSSNWNTKIVSGDGERAFRWARINESFAPGVTVGEVVRACALAMGLGVGNLNAQISFLSEQFVNGFSAFGKASSLLDQLLRSRGREYSIQDGQLQVLSTNESTTIQVPDLSPDTGLIGSPEFGESEKNKGPTIKIKCLLSPSIKPGGLVQLNSLRYKGLVRVTSLTHNGDTSGGEWYTSFEGTPAR